MNWHRIFSDAVYLVIGLAIARQIANGLKGRGVNISASDPPTT